MAKKQIVRPRTAQQLELMRQSGLINTQALEVGLKAIKVGMTTKELDQIVEKEIERLDGQPAFKKVPRFKWATCININDTVVHGIPNDYQIKAGDLVSIDVGTIYQGWYSDGAWTVIVNEKSNIKDQKDEEKERFLDVGQKALKKAIEQAVEGNRIGDIAHAMQLEIEGAGYSVVKSLAGHGVGKSYHEEPEVPGFGKPGTGMKLQAGMTLAIEAIYAQGRGDIYQQDDGWTLASVDESLTALFEHTVIVGKEKAEIIC